MIKLIQIKCTDKDDDNMIINMWYFFLNLYKAYKVLGHNLTCGQ